MEDKEKSCCKNPLINALKKLFCDHDYYAVVMINDGDGFIKCEKCKKMLYFYDYYKSENAVNVKIVRKKGG